MNSVFELSNIPSVFAAKNVVRLKETNLDEFVHQCIPLALQAGFVSVREGFFQHGESPALGKGERGIPLLKVAGHLGAQGLELVLGSCLARGGQTGDSVDVGGIGAADVFNQSGFTGGVEGFNGVNATFFNHT